MSQVEKRKRKRIKLNSDAFPKNNAGILEDKIFALSEIHDKIKYEDIHIDKDQVYIKELTKSHLGEIVKLHREWFPVDYTDEFFLNMFSRNSAKVAANIIALGAFIQIEEKEYILGSIFCEIKNEKNFYSSTKLKINNKTFCDKIFNFYEYCYIMTIGVIDECRNIGLGSKLLNEVISFIQTKRKKCLAIYLHVIEYNTVAIRFYLKNEFVECNNIRNYYFLNQTYFQGKVLCKIFSNDIVKISVKESISNLDEPDSTSSNIIYLIISGVISLISSCFCCCKK